MAAASFSGAVNTNETPPTGEVDESTFDGGAVSIVQGGGYRLPIVTTIPKFAPVVLEYNLPNARGTLASTPAGLTTWSPR